MSKPIVHKVKFNVPPNVVYQTLVDAKKHKAFTGEGATNQPKKGGSFTAYGGYIHGVNVELVKGKRIVQAWRGGDFPKGVYSIATFDLKKKGKGTELKFTQYGVPSNRRAGIDRGWRDFYWKLMAEYFEK